MCIVFITVLYCTVVYLVFYYFVIFIIDDTMTTKKVQSVCAGMRGCRVYVSVGRVLHGARVDIRQGSGG